MKSAKKVDGSGKLTDNVFKLPKTISRHVKLCQKEHEGNGKAEQVRFVWVYVSRESRKNPGVPGKERMSEAQWLGIVDEAASLGATCLVVCVDDALGNHPEVWSLCRWAQEAYGMKAALYVYDGIPLGDDMEQLTQLDLDRTCLFVDPEKRSEVQYYAERGVHICDAIPGTANPEEMCRGGQQTVCISASGNMYTCGVVLGDQNFRLGHAYERPIAETVLDSSLPHAVPGAICSEQGGCRVCPPRMAKELG